MPDDDLRALIDSVVAEARRLATREDGSVDTYREALEFRRLLVEAAGREPDSAEPGWSPSGDDPGSTSVG